MLKDVLGFPERQKKTTYGLSYKLTLTRNKDNVVLDNVPEIADAGIRVDFIHWYVPH